MKYIVFAFFVFLCIPTHALSYPLNASERTQIDRLEGYSLLLPTPSGQRNISPGALLKTKDISLSLLGNFFSLPKQDAYLSQELIQLLPEQPQKFGVALLDISDPTAPRYASYNPGRVFIPASTGKVIIGLAVLQTLADVFGPSIPLREKILRETNITADSFILTDSHVVPFWSQDNQVMSFRPIEEGDNANLWTYLDWMFSASSNAAASTLMKQLILMEAFQKSYPPSPLEEEAFFKTTSKQKLTSTIYRLMRRAIQSNGLNPDRLMQASFFTKGGKKVIPSRGSSGTPNEFLQLLLYMEQGRLIDPFSSLELKRLLYNTQKRTRYASAQELERAAIYHKSGSLYSCTPERNFICDDYMGNVRNILNAATLIEYPSHNPQIRYIVTMTSNVLRKSSPDLHRDVANRIHRLMKRLHQISTYEPRQVYVGHLKRPKPKED